MKPPALLAGSGRFPEENEVGPDADLRSMYEAGYPVLGGQRRQITDLATPVRQVRTTQQEIARYDAAVREKAEPLGYTV
jgi:hypothetical protein